MKGNGEKWKDLAYIMNKMKIKSKGTDRRKNSKNNPKKYWKKDYTIN